MSPDVLAKGDKRGDRKQNPRPGEPCWRQTGRRSRARRPAGWGGIKHGRHRTQRCHFLEQLKLRLKRVTGPHPSTLELFKLNPGGNRKNPIKKKLGAGLAGPDQPFRSSLAHCPYCSHSPCLPSASALLSALFQPPIGPDKPPQLPPRKTGALVLNAGINVVFCTPPEGTSRAAIPPPPRHNSSIVQRVPPGPKPRRIPPPPPLEPACARFVHGRLSPHFP